MSEQKGIPVAVLITVVVSIALGVGGIASAAVARTESLRMEMALKQEERVRSLEIKGATRDEQYSAIAASLIEIKLLLKGHMEKGSQ